MLLPRERITAGTLGRQAAAPERRCTRRAFTHTFLMPQFAASLSLLSLSLQAQRTVALVQFLPPCALIPPPLACGTASLHHAWIQEAHQSRWLLFASAAVCVRGATREQPLTRRGLHSVGRWACARWQQQSAVAEYGSEGNVVRYLSLRSRAFGACLVACGGACTVLAAHQASDCCGGPAARLASSSRSTVAAGGGTAAGGAW